jgi:hypothetical protein
MIEDDHMEGTSGLLLEGEELAYLQLDDGKGCPLLVVECIVTDFLVSRPLAATSVVADDDVGRDGTEPFDELGRDWELPKGHLEVFRPFIVMEVANGSRPSSTLLGQTLIGNLRRCP